MVPESAAAAYLVQQQISALTAATVNRLWAGMADDFDQSWAAIRPQMLEVVTAGQLATARRATSYVQSVLDETGQDGGDPAGTLNAAAFTGAASDGRDLGTLLDQAPIQAKAAVAGGLEVPEALAQAGRFLSLATLTQVADTRREVVSADIGQRPKLQGYVRMLNPPSCYRCAILAGKFYRWNDGFLRHPRCFPAGVVVSGPEFAAATRRWYEGELTILHTASGKRLPITGNHPVLTDQGWIPANLVREGDNLVGSTLTEGASPLVVPHEQHRPTLVEDVWGSAGMGGLRRVPTAPEDFHGDGTDGEVDVVFADSLLRDRGLASFGEPSEHGLFAAGFDLPHTLDAESPSEELLRRLLDSPDGGVGGFGLRGALFGGHLRSAHETRVAAASRVAALLEQVPADHVSAYSVARGEAEFAFASLVGLDEFGPAQADGLLRWDAPAGAFAEENRAAYASRGADLRGRLAGQVALDGIVEVERVSWSGHVYNLTSSEGWFSANGLIVSNCDCVHIPTSENRAGDFRTDPYAYFKSLSATDQIAVFGKSEARAINDGADIYRVANIRNRGLATAGSQQAIRYGTPTRVTVDQIYRTAGTRANAVRMMQENGYITGPQRVGGNIVGQREGFGALGKGGKARTASQAVTQARVTGVRDPLNRYTMTAAERRLYDAKARLDAAEKQGVWLQSVGANSADKFNRPKPVTPTQLAILRRNYANEVARARTGPPSVRRLATLIGVAL